MLSEHGSTGANVAAGGVLVLIAGGSVAGATQTSETGPVLAFVGALIVAVIASRTSKSNVSKQLKGEADRHQKSLDSDRKLVDVQYLREVLDSAAAAFEEATSACVAFAIWLKRLPDNVQDQERRVELFQGAIDGEKHVATAMRRIGMRFPPEHSVSSAYAEVLTQVQERVGVLADFADLDKVLTDEANAEDDDYQAKAYKAFDSFVDAVRVEIGVLQRQAEYVGAPRE